MRDWCIVVLTFVFYFELLPFSLLSPVFYILYSIHMFDIYYTKLSFKSQLNSV